MQCCAMLYRMPSVCAVLLKPFMLVFHIRGILAQQLRPEYIVCFKDGTSNFNRH